MISQNLPPIIREFLTYHRAVMGHAEKTVEEYALDLRLFCRWLLRERGLAGDTPFGEIDILPVDVPLLRSVTRADIYGFLAFLQQDRQIHPGSVHERQGLSPVSYARKEATLRSFFRYLFAKAEVLADDPMKSLDTPKKRRTQPRYLTEEEAVRLLSAVDGPNRDRDYCMLVLLLNCALRISELTGLNLGDIRPDGTLRISGKGGKMRTVYLNDACAEALSDWLPRRRPVPGPHEQAVFLSRNHGRISSDAVQALVKKHLQAAGIDPTGLSPHKLRHTAATLMLRAGVDVRALQEVLGHSSISTTQIYTHIDNENLRVAARANPLGNVKKGDL